MTQVSAVQLPFTYFSTPQEFADHVRAPVEEAAQAGAQLILLPHLASSMLFGMFDFDATPDDPLEQLAARQNIPVHEWLQSRAGYVYEFYLHLFQSLAERTETWLAPGTVLEVDGDALYLTALFFNPSGEIVGRQRQTQRSRQEIAWRVLPGDSLRVLNTEIGDIGFVIGEDVRYPENARKLVSAGATVLLHPAAYRRATVPAPGDADPLAHVYQDIRHDVLANHVFGVQANLVGGHFYGRSSIYAPLELTPNNDGILAQAQTDSDAGSISAALDFDRLRPTV